MEDQTIELDLSPLEAARINSTMMMIRSLAPEAQVLKDPETLPALLGVCFSGGLEPRALYDANKVLVEGKYKAEDFFNAPISMAVVNNLALDNLLQMVLSYPKVASDICDSLAETEQGQALLPMLLVVKGMLLSVEEQNSVDAQAAVLGKMIAKRVSDLEQAASEEG